MSLRGAYAGFGDENDPVRQMALKLRSLLAVNSPGSVFPGPKAEDLDFPDVDCDDVFPGIYIGDS